MAEIPFRLLILKRLMQQLGTIPWNQTPLELTVEKQYSHIQRGKAVFTDQEDPLPLVSILETFDVQFVRGSLTLAAEAGENLSSRFFDAIDLGPLEGPEGSTEYHLHMQGWTDKDGVFAIDTVYPLLALVQQTLTGLRMKKMWRLTLDAQGQRIVPAERELIRVADLPEDEREGWLPDSLLGLGKRAPMVDSIEFGRGVVRPADGESDRAGFWLALVLTLIEDFENPFVEED